LKALTIFQLLSPLEILGIPTMTRKAHLSLLLASACACLIISQTSKAADYWWDSNTITSGFGNITGTWGISAFWSTSSAGTATPTAATTTSSDVVNFGTSTLNYANATVGIALGGVTVNSIVYGAGQTTGITLGTVGNSLTLAGTTPIITVNNANNVTQTILSPINGSDGLKELLPVSNDCLVSFFHLFLLLLEAL
jgi:hypothetical protein